MAGLQAGPGVAEAPHSLGWAWRQKGVVGFVVKFGPGTLVNDQNHGFGFGFAKTDMVSVSVETHFGFRLTKTKTFHSLLS